MFGRLLWQKLPEESIQLDEVSKSGKGFEAQFKDNKGFDFDTMIV